MKPLTFVSHKHSFIQISLSFANWRENELEADFFFSGLFPQSSRKLRNMPLLLANKLNKLLPDTTPKA